MTSVDRVLVNPIERLEQLERENAQLREALESRIVIEQAKGVLAERFGTPIPVAFELLRRAARSSQRRLHELAAEVVAEDETPSSVLRERERLGR